jgi:hypothetical protein
MQEYHHALKRLILSAAVGLSLFVVEHRVSARTGAEIPWVTYEAEEMKTTGTVLGPKYGPFLVETESSRQQCVQLTEAGQFVEFAAKGAANALVMRFNLPDSKSGGGVNATLKLSINGRSVKNLALSSHWSWLYGAYPFSNQPGDGKPRNFYDENRLLGMTIAPGDVIRLEKISSAPEYCIIDLVDLENVPPPRAAPAESLSVLDFGADGSGQTDDTEALRRCVAAAAKQRTIVWVPAGNYKIAGDIVVPSDVTIQGAGIWHTTFAGDADLYDQADKRVRFKLTGTNIHLADFAIAGKLNYRNDNEPNDGVVGARCADATVSRVWVEHTKTGAWIYNGTRLVIDSCRFRNLLADGVNFCVDTRDSVVQNSTTRGTGDDCFAIWPTPSDQGYTQQNPEPGNNVFRNCTGELPFLANGGCIYGGANNRIENCRFTDISPGCGILISSTFPTSDDKYDNNFSGTTTVKDCELVRCGGYDHTWAWRAAFQLCLERSNISGVLISNVTIQDSISDGFSVVAPGSEKGHGTLSNVRLDRVNITSHGIGADSRHGLWIREDASGGLAIGNSKISDTLNAASNNFNITEE